MKILIDKISAIIEIWEMPLYRNIDLTAQEILLEDIRRYYFDHTKRTLRIEDAKYLLERAEELGLNKSNGGLEALFSSLKYKFDQREES